MEGPADDDRRDGEGSRARRLIEAHRVRPERGRSKQSVSGGRGKRRMEPQLERARRHPGAPRATTIIWTISPVSGSVHSSTGLGNYRLGPANGLRAGWASFPAVGIRSHSPCP